MKRAQRHWMRRVGMLAACGFAGALVFMLFFRGQPVLDDGDFLTAFLVAVFMAMSLTLCESLVVPRTRRMKLLPALLIRSDAYALGAIGSVCLGILLANVLQDGWDQALIRFGDLITVGDVARGCIFGLAVVVVLVFIGSVSQKLGPGVLLNWLLGRYHEPRRERCVFLFLDLRDSTRLAERLGDERFSALLRDVFYDITPALLDHDARISHFIGDEIVLYWPIRNEEAPDSEFARCFFSIQRLLGLLAGKYEERYGVVPGFKGGAHCGDVIATDVGQIKSEIVFHGDVLNVASRLEGLCNEEGANLLISGDLASSLGGEEGFQLEDKGERLLKGKDQAIRIFAVSCAGPGRQPL